MDDTRRNWFSRFRRRSGTAGTAGPDTELLRTVLLSTAAFSLAVHGFLFSNEFFSHDSISYFAYADWGLPFYTGLGRFLIPLYEACKGGVAAPWLIGGLFVLWMALSAALTARLLDLRRRSAQILLCGLLCTNLALTLTGATYIYCLDEYALALCGAAAAALLFYRGGRLSAFAGLLPLIASLSLYQPYFTVAASLCLLAVLRDAAGGRRTGRIIRAGVRSLALLAVGYLLYDRLWSVVCAAVGVERARSARPMLFDLPEVLPGLYRDFFRYLLEPAGVLGPLLPAVHTVLVLLLAWKLLSLLADGGLRAGNRVLLLGAVLLLPIALRAVFLLIPDDAHDLTAYARELFFLPALFVMDPLRAGDRPRPAAPWRTAMAVLLCLALWHHGVFANQAYMKKDLEKSATLVLAARIIDRIEAVEGYVPGQTPVSFAGRMDYNTFLNQPPAAFSDLSDYTGLWHNYAATYNLGRYLTEYLHYPLIWDTEKNYTGLPEVRTMPVFPAAGSVKMVDGVVVVKFTWAVTGDADGNPLP